MEGVSLVWPYLTASFLSSLLAVPLAVDNLDVTLVNSVLYVLCVFLFFFFVSSDAAHLGLGIKKNLFFMDFPGDGQQYAGEQLGIALRPRLAQRHSSWH